MHVKLRVRMRDVRRWTERKFERVIPRHHRGIGFRDLHAFNQAMLAEQGWNMLVNPDALVSKLLKAKYFPRGTFIDSQLRGNPSFS